MLVAARAEVVWPGATESSWGRCGGSRGSMMGTARLLEPSEHSAAWTWSHRCLCLECLDSHRVGLAFVRVFMSARCFSSVLVELRRERSLRDKLILRCLATAGCLNGKKKMSS